MTMPISLLIFSCMGVSFFLFLRQREHFLVALLLLELIAIFFVLLIPLLGMFIGQSSLVLVLIILTLSACEASLGLAVLVYMIRLYGNDMLRSMVTSSF